MHAVRECVVAREATALLPEHRCIGDASPYGEPAARFRRLFRRRRYLSVSTVIQKFLSTEHMPLLKRYMERVAATPSVMRAAYAAVLLSLYVQLRDGEALRRFIDNSIDGDGGYKWNVDDAISTCLNGTTVPPRAVLSMHVWSCPRCLCAACGLHPCAYRRP